MSSFRTPTFSFVIATFNRAALVVHSIQSALDWLENQHGEIIIVDDASSDGTIVSIRQKFQAELQSGRLSLLQQEHNSGVIKSKNRGAAAARGQWIIFLDSDDQMRIESATLMHDAFVQFAHIPALFFRCEEIETGRLIGSPLERPHELTLQRYLNCSTHAECLPAIRNDIFQRYRYDESLNGWEGLTYARIMRDVGAFMVLPIIARRYRTTGDDRLSSELSMRHRAQSLAHGHAVLLLEFFHYLTNRRRISQVAKISYYWLRARGMLPRLS